MMDEKITLIDGWMVHTQSSGRVSAESTRNLNIIHELTDRNGR